MKQIGVLCFAQKTEEGLFYKLSPDYIEVIESIGYRAIIIPFDSIYIDDFVLELDAFLIPGGQDICPDYYFEEVNGARDFCYLQDKSAFQFIEKVIKAKKPLFGICRGMQLINVFFSGTLHQHIENHILHNQYEKRYESVHDIRLVEKNFLETIFGKETIAVNSIHHQAIKYLGEGLKVAAYDAESDVIEAIEHQTLPVFGVQWHPEKLKEQKELFKKVFS